MGIDKRYTTPYHPSANGAAERYVQSAKKILAKFLEGATEDWHHYIPSVQLMINNKISTRLQTTPFSLMFARNINDFIEYRDDAGELKKKEYMPHDEMLKRIDYMSQVVFPAIQDRIDLYTKRQKEKADNKNRQSTFPEGSPYRIVHQVQGGAYILRDVDETLMSRNYSPEELKIISQDEVIPKDEFKDDDSWLTAEAFTHPESINIYWRKLGKSFNQNGESYTIELQDRGSPHVHMVLWTGKSSEELMGMESLVVAHIPSYGDNPELYQLRAVYRRSVVDGNVNGYNPHLLKLLKVSMDIQINSSGRVLYYLAKYLSKIDTPVDITTGADQARSHFKARQVGAVDAAYFLCGWNKHRSSRGTVFISTVFPGEDEKCQLRTNIGMLAPDDTNIFSRTHLEKFLNRYDQVRHLCMVEYFTTYILTEVMDVEDEFGEGGAVRIGVYDRGTINQREEVFFHERLQSWIPKVCTDRFGNRYRARDQRRKKPVWRTHAYSQSEGDAFYFQQVVLWYPIQETDLSALLDRREGSWENVYAAVCQESNFRQDREVVESVLRLRETLRVASETAGGGMAVEPQVTSEEEVMRMLQQASTEQLAIYQHLCEYSTSGLYFVFGAAGSGKSFLLNLLRLTCIPDQVQPVVLAPTGIAAQNVQGETIHRFFGFSEHRDEPNLVRLQDFVKTHKHIVFLIDECSMISKRLLETMSRCLHSMTGNHEDFGGAMVVCFGDAAQLPPTTAAADGFFFQSALTSFAFTY
ncbi:hypothetical protein G6F64_011587 [Rhizopus arrhizus]|uniref:ATP-dependent DNA helicase n=1 Tax=Rhizopus oryzae TaxID=64495 RepID=A0A9P6WYW1_RHIOR|nr:hypothetical protein G6F32_011555 [Rhizopus arrhizus]KAG1301679.1 hypothetical protein G6F64_011587 [Rhizopus arrhizus]